MIFSQSLIKASKLYKMGWKVFKICMCFLGLTSFSYEPELNNPTQMSNIPVEHSISSEVKQTVHVYCQRSK